VALKDDINSIGDTKCADDTDQTAAQDPAPLNPPTKTRIKCSEKVSKPARVDHVLEMTKDISSLEEDIRYSFPDISKQIRNDEHSLFLHQERVRDDSMHFSTAKVLMTGMMSLSINLQNGDERWNQALTLA